MYKVIWLTKFRPDVPRDDVIAWWRGPHAEMAAATPGMLRYTQSLWVTELDPVTQLATGRPGIFDGHAEHWFADRDTYGRAMASPQWQRCRDDGPTGFAFDTLLGAELEETVISWRPDDGMGYKLIALARFNPDRSRDEVLEWWRGHHGELAAATPGMNGYVQSHWVSALDGDTQLATGTRGRWDGHAEHWFPDRAAYEAAMSSPEWHATIVDGPTGFVDEALTRAELVETVIAWDPMDDGRKY